MPRVVHFEIPADDPERAMAFYKDVFDWKIDKWNGPHDYWLCTTGPNDQMGINGGILKREPNMVTTNTIGVENLDEFVAKVVEKGGKNVVPKMPIPGVGWLAYCTDTEGNMFGLMQPDVSAQ